VRRLKGGGRGSRWKRMEIMRRMGVKQLRKPNKWEMRKWEER